MVYSCGGTFYSSENGQTTPTNVDEFHTYTDEGKEAGAHAGRWLSDTIHMKLKNEQKLSGGGVATGGMAGLAAPGLCYSLTGAHDLGTLSLWRYAELPSSDVCVPVIRENTLKAPFLTGGIGELEG